MERREMRIGLDKFKMQYSPYLFINFFQIKKIKIYFLFEDSQFL